MDDAETLFVAAGPFKVIHQTPNHIARHGHTLLHGITHGGDMPCEVIGSPGIVHFAIDEVVVKSSAVFGDVQRWYGVVAVQAHQ